MNGTHVRIALATALALVTAPAGAANWLVLNSAEAPEGAPTMSVFGFIQPTYRDIDDSDKAPNGQRPIFNTLSPGPLQQLRLQPLPGSGWRARSVEQY